MTKPFISIQISWRAKPEVGGLVQQKFLLSILHEQYAVCFLPGISLQQELAFSASCATAQFS